MLELNRSRRPTNDRISVFTRVGEGHRLHLVDKAPFCLVILRGQDYLLRRPLRFARGGSTHLSPGACELRTITSLRDLPANFFDTFWHDPANERWFSGGDVTALASAILTACGGGPLLDVGCGSGRLLGALRRHGVAVGGVDSSLAAVTLCNAQAPGSAVLGDALALPLADDSFDTVVCTGLPDLLDDTQLAILLGQLRRVARRSVVLVSVANTWPQSIDFVAPPRSRAQVQAIAFAAGLRRHPGELRVVPYAALEADRLPRTIMFEPLGEGPHQQFPLSWLDEHHDLHHDHLRGSGRRADAHLARYALACDLVREGDRVLDIACGMGYGSRMLAVTSTAATVMGVDNDARALEYARANFASPRTTFTRDDAHTLATIQDGSADVIISFETLEHLPEPDAFLARAAHILRPGGRLIVSVPNQWADHTGTDPNPHHHHVYSVQRLQAELQTHFIIEQTFCQTAGGGWKLSDEPRHLELLMATAAATRAEWIVMVAMKSPIGAGADFKETLFPQQPSDPGYNLYNFNRDYDNPALFRSLICKGPRLADETQLKNLAQQVLATCRPGSPDQGAATCVLAYQTLAEPNAAAARLRLTQIDAFAAVCDGTPHAIGWVISGQYVAAQLLLAIGERGEALARFESCAAMDAAAFSPVLGTKTVDAACWAGVLHAFEGRLDAARRCWVRGIHEAKRLSAEPWLNVIGDEQTPQPHGLLELSHVLDAASHCVGWLCCASRLNEQPGLALTLARRQTAGDTSQHIQDLLAAKRRLEGQLTLGAASDELAAQVQRLRESLASIEASRNWLSEQVGSYTSAALKAASDYEQAKQWGTAADEGRKWLQGQLNEAKSRDANQIQIIDELRTHIDDLQVGKTWLEGQYATQNALSSGREQIINELRTYIAQLEEAKGWHAGQTQQAMAIAKAKEDALTTAHAASSSTGAQLAEHASTIAGLERRLTEAHDGAAAQARVAASQLAEAQETTRRVQARGLIDRLLNKEPGC